MIVSLVQQSYDLDPHVPVWLRLSLLTEQAQMASQLRPDLGRDWANELFELSFQTKGAQRSSVQITAMGLLIGLDPDRALDLLHSLSMDAPEGKWAFWPPKMQLAQQVFQVLAARDGVSALPLLEQEAESLGIQGHYPYAALGSAVMQATSKYWGSDNEHAIQILESVFEPAFARYSRNPHEYSDDFEFGEMLQVVAGGLPPDSVKLALHTLAKNLLAADTRKLQLEAEVYSRDGEHAKADNAVDATILFFGGLINRDPELAQQLESTRPELQMALKYTEPGRKGSLSFGPSSAQNRHSRNQDAEMSMDAARLVHINPEAAIAKAKQLQDDDKRANAMLQVARDIAGNYPERAAELIATTQLGIKPTDDQLHLNLISAQAYVAAALNKKDELHDLLQLGFESAGHIHLEEPVTEGIQIVEGLAPLVQIGVQYDPDLTITYIETLPPSPLKASLLLGAASALSFEWRLPFSSRPQQGVDKPDQ
jgi:hypothetical protein